MIKAVLLDMDGTIVDAFPPIIRALNQTFAEFGLPQMTPEEIKRHTGKGDCSMKALFGERRDEAASRFLEIHDEDYLDKIKPLAGAETLFQWLQACEIPTAIVTSKSQIRAEAQLHRLNWTGYFNIVIGKMDGRKGKPDPAPVLLACDQLGIAPQHAVMVGDGTADMKSASRAGTLAVGMCDAFSAAELAEVGANHCFDSLTEVHTWLKTQIN